MSTSDLWGTSVKLIKIFCINNNYYVTDTQLVAIFNNCIEYGVFPDLNKFSR